jgi:arsenite methyltransferase
MSGSDFDKNDERQAARAEQVPEEADRVVQEVRKRYGRIASGSSTSCCEPSKSVACCSPGGSTARQLGYDQEDLNAVPEGSDLGLGCGAPIRHLRLEAGETVLDLGSGAGFDAFLAAPHVGQTGRVIGVDMTPEMIERARQNARKAGFKQVEFREGRLEALPVENSSVDAVTSNCVINLVPDKAEVFREIARVLRSGGRLVISDIVLDGELPEAVTRDLLAYVGCVAGALRRERYFSMLEAAGLTGIEILSDVDFLGIVGKKPPEEIAELLDRTGVEIEELRGKVRSVTYRARKS